MKITDIKPERGHLSRIFCDNGFDFTLDRDICPSCGITAGTDITNEKIRELTALSDYERAKSRAMWYLDRADRPEKELYDKLIKAQFNPTAAAKVIARLKELGLIDDRRYAQLYVEKCFENNISSRAAYAKLLIKKIPRDIAREAVDNAEADEPAQIKAVIEKKYRNKLSSKAEISKVYAALIRKGFSFGAVRDALKSYSEELQYIDGE